MKKIALITCRTLPEPDSDQDVLLAALGAAGFDASMLSWDDPVGDPAAPDLCVLRSTWDYHKHPGSFLKWIERADKTGRLMNPGAVVRWNYHKRYLSELASAGVPIVPTEFCERGEAVKLASLMESNSWDDVVVKPSVSGGSFRTRRFSKAQTSEGEEFLRSLLKDRDAMVQLYIPAVEGDEGERAIVWIDGDITHVVRKAPRFAGHEESVSRGMEATDEERLVAEQAIAAARDIVGRKVPLLYGRVDVVRGPDKQLCVSELELIEPSLFLVQYPPALDRFVEALGKFSADELPVVSADPSPGPRKPFGRAPERGSFESYGTWRPEGPKQGGGEPRGRRSEARGPRPGGWGQKRDGAGGPPWKGKGSGGRDHWRSKRDGAPRWTPKEDEQPPSHAPGVWSPEMEKQGGWKPPERSSGGFKPRGQKSGGWKPRGEGGRGAGGGKRFGGQRGGTAPGGFGRSDERRGRAGARPSGPGGHSRPAGPGRPTGQGGPGQDRRTGGRPAGPGRPGGPAGDRRHGGRPGASRPGGGHPGGSRPGGGRPGGGRPGGSRPGGGHPGGGRPGGGRPGGGRPGGGRPGGGRSGGRKGPR